MLGGWPPSPTAVGSLLVQGIKVRDDLAEETGLRCASKKGGRRSVYRREGEKIELQMGMGWGRSETSAKTK